MSSLQGSVAEAQISYQQYGLHTLLFMMTFNSGSFGKENGSLDRK